MSAPVAITGIGAICALGSEPAQIYRALRAGRTAFAPLRQWDSAGWPAPLAAGVERIDAGAIFDDRRLLKSVQRLRRTDLLGLYAASRAVTASAMLEYRAALPGAQAVEFNERTAVFTGCGGVAYHYQYDFLNAMAAGGGDLRVFGQKLGESVNPTWLLQALPNNVLCYLGIAYGFKGANSCITNHSVSATMAIIEAMETLRTGDADRAVAVGHDSPIEPEAILNLYHLGLLTADTTRPFDAGRSGCLLGEGAAAMVLETQAAAAERHAPVLGIIIGAGVTTEALGVLGIRADGDGAVRAMEMALEAAGITPRDVAMIAAHGNGTVNSDRSEANAIRRVFGADMPPVTSFKWALGHTMAAAGALEAVLVLECLRNGAAPGIGALRDPDPQCLPLAVSASATALHGDIALVLGRGFGGMNTALLLKAPPDATP
jgi:3-oxoacyl-[acyl-carrier-protein] synthase II